MAPAQYGPQYAALWCSSSGRSVLEEGKGRLKGSSAGKAVFEDEIGRGGGLVENPVETDPPLVHIIDPLPFSFSSGNKMQAGEMKKRSSLHSI